MEKPAWWSSDEWATPPVFVERWAKELGLDAFTLDACCRPETAKAEHYFTKTHDSLLQLWFGAVCLNPPYSKIRPWLQKARASVAVPSACSLVCALLPAAVDTSWFHEEVLMADAEIRFVRGRLRFLGWEGTPIPAPKTPSLIVIYRAKSQGR